MGERTCGEWFGRRSVRIVHNILHWYLGYRCESHCICSPSKWNAVFIVESIQDNDALFNHRNGNHEFTWLHVLLWNKQIRTCVHIFCFIQIFHWNSRFKCFYSVCISKNNLSLHTHIIKVQCRLYLGPCSGSEESQRHEFQC